jgi:hypothetical protein
LNYDWVNIALPGTDNIAIMITAQNYIKNLKNEYEKIQLVITLTESGREFNNGNFLKKKEEYNLIKGVDWPSYEDTVKGTDITFVLEECYTNSLKIGYDLSLYYAVKSATDVNDFLLRYEAFTFNMIKKMFNNVEYLVGRNFTYTYPENKHILGCNLMDEIWVNIISKFGKIEEYPKDVYVMSGIGLDPLLLYLKELKLNNKEKLLPIITNASLGIDWLYNSKYNSNHATKHPLEQAHQWWADYIYESLKIKNTVKI